MNAQILSPFPQATRQALQRQNPPFVQRPRKGKKGELHGNYIIQHVVGAVLKIEQGIDGR